MAGRHRTPDNGKSSYGQENDTPPNNPGRDDKHASQEQETTPMDIPARGKGIPPWQT